MQFYLDFTGLTGDVVTPRDPRYEFARQDYNRAIQRFPAAIVYCLEPEDIGNAIEWSQRNCVGLRIRSGGHNYEGYSIGNGVLVVDVSRLRAISISPSGNLLRTQAGVRNRELYDALAELGRPFPGGSCPAVGISGYTLGGGWNLSCRLLGLGCDSLVSARMVNWRGETLTASECENQGLFWALRGGGDGNFGVVSELTFRLPDAPDDVTYFTFGRSPVSGLDQQSFLAEWQRWLPGLDRRMTLRPSLYNSADEGLGIFSRGLFYGEPDEALRILEPLLASVGLEVETQYLPFADAMRLIGENYPATEMFQSTGRFAQRQLSPGEIGNIVGLLSDRPGGVELIELGLFALGGKVRDVPKTATAFFWRCTDYILGMQAVWTDPAYKETGRAWVQHAFNVISPLTVGSFVNFPYSELQDYEEAYYGGNLPRLRAVKREVDPQNVFRYPQSIRP